MLLNMCLCMAWFLSNVSRETLLFLYNHSFGVSRETFYWLFIQCF